MLRYLGRRLAYALALLLAVVTLNFLLIHISPGDPVETIAGSMGGISEELRAQRAIRLDKPFIAQLGLYLGQVLRGDLGHSYFFNLPVTQLIWDRVPATLLLVVTSVLGAFLAGTLLGTLAARKPNGPLSQGITLLSIVGYSAPVFWTGILLIILFASMLPIFPVSDMRTAGASELGWAGALDVLHHLVLPACTLGFVYLAQYSWLARASVIEALSADYIRTARAKGRPSARCCARAAQWGAAGGDDAGPARQRAGRRHPGRDGSTGPAWAGWPRLGAAARLSDAAGHPAVRLPAGGGDEPAHRSGLSAGRSPDQDIMSQIRRAPGAVSAVSVSSVSSAAAVATGAATPGRAPVRRRASAARLPAQSSAVVGLLLLAAVLAVTLFGPALMPGDPSRSSARRWSRPAPNSCWARTTWGATC